MLPTDFYPSNHLLSFQKNTIWKKKLKIGIKKRKKVKSVESLSKTSQISKLFTHNKKTFKNFLWVARVSNHANRRGGGKIYYPKPRWGKIYYIKYREEVGNYALPFSHRAENILVDKTTLPNYQTLTTKQNEIIL